MSDAPAFAMRGIVKAFGGVQALAGATLIVDRGTVHGLVGQNGAGKSTLIKILAGLHAPDGGAIEFDGAAQAHLTPHKVERLGVHFIHQDRLLAPTLTIAEALFLGEEPRRFGVFIDRARLEREAREALKRTFDMALPTTALIQDLSTAEQQVVQITRALLRQPKVLVFDEPTTALVRREATFLFQAIDRFRAAGLTVVYISHYLSEIHELCDSVTVLRNGVDVATVDARTTPTKKLVSLMIDRSVETLFQRRTVAPGPPALTFENLSCPGAFANVNLTLRRGEIVGVAGLLGSGAKAIARALYGLEAPSAGRILVNGRPLPLGSPRAAAAHRIGLVPEDRRRHGVALDMSVRENATLPTLKSFSRHGFLNLRAERRRITDLIVRLNIHAPGSETPVRALSGGNQQKVALSKWLIQQADVIILDEPTVGVDIGAKVDIYRQIGALAEKGAAILVVSSDLLELTGLADRVLVFFRGAIVAELAGAEANQDRLLTLVTTGRDEGGRSVQAA
jgi:ribose transport system ATP-binding protein